MSSKFVAFLICLVLSIYLLMNGWLIIGLVFLGLAILIPAA
jgi:hypothetical protein